MPSTHQAIDTSAVFLSWLADEPNDNCFTDLEELRQHLTQTHADTIAAEQIQSFCTQACIRAIDISGRFKPMLLNTALPLPEKLYTGIATLISVLTEVSDLLYSLINRLYKEQLGNSKLPEIVILLSSKGLELISEAFLLSCMGSINTNNGMWRRTSHFITLFEQPPETKEVLLPETVAAQYKRILLVSTMQPDSLSTREAAWAFEYFAPLTRLVALTTTFIPPNRTAFWIDPDLDHPPIAYVRSPPPPDIYVFYFQAAPLMREISNRIGWLEQRIHDAELIGLSHEDDLLDTETSGLPLGLTTLEALLLMRRIRDRWRMPPSREHHRQLRLYSVQVCYGLPNIWRLLHKGSSTQLTEWTVCNESPGGFAIVSNKPKQLEGILEIGMVLALRAKNHSQWTICIVRRIRTENAEQIELGLELLARSSQPVTIGFRGSGMQTVTPALILPPIMENRRNDAVLAPSGTYTSRRFVLISENPHLYVTQGRVLSLDIQTSSIELFQYETDPYPI